MERATSRRILALLIGLAVLVRLPGLNEGLWFDEIWTLIDQVRAPLSKSVASFESDNNHPLYSVLAWLSVRAFGESAWALRFPALLFGVAAIPALYLFARELLSERQALVCAALLTFSFHHVAYSQNARAYTMLLTFTLVSSTAFLKACEEERRSWVLQGVALALATYAHLTGVFVALAQLVAWLIPSPRAERRNFSPLFGVVLGGVLSLALHAPMLSDMLAFFTGGERGANVDAEWTSFAWTLSEIGRSVGAQGHVGLTALAVGSIIGLLGLSTIAKRNFTGALLCVLPTLLGASTLVLLGRNLWPRFFFFCAGFYLVVAVAGFARPSIVGRPRIAGALLASALLAFCVKLPVVWKAPLQDFVGARDFVEAQRDTGDVFVTLGLAQFPFEAWLETDYVPTQSVEEIEAALLPAKRAYALSTFPIYLESRQPEVAGWLAEHGVEEHRFYAWIGGGDVVLYRLK